MTVTDLPRGTATRCMQCPCQRSAGVHLESARSSWQQRTFWEDMMSLPETRSKEHQMTGNPPAGTRILGSLRSEGGMGVVRMEDRFDSDVDDVWSALTEPSRLARWYGEVEGDLRVGGEYRARLHATGWEGTGRVEACGPPRRLMVTGQDPDEPNEGVTEVTLTRSGCPPCRAGALRCRCPVGRTPACL